MNHLYIVSYDISDPRRWRGVYRTLKGYGEWVQLSVFQCRMSRKRALLLESLLSDLVNHREDHVLFIDLGPADNVKPKIGSIGKAFVPIEQAPVIV